MHLCQINLTIYLIKNIRVYCDFHHLINDEEKVKAFLSYRSDSHRLSSPTGLIVT
jgi:hypothetical protein